MDEAKNASPTTSAEGLAMVQIHRPSFQLPKTYSLVYSGGGHLRPSTQYLAAREVLLRCLGAPYRGGPGDPRRYRSTARHHFLFIYSFKYSHGH